MLQVVLYLVQILLPQSGADVEGIELKETAIFPARDESASYFLKRESDLVEFFR